MIIGIIWRFIRRILRKLIVAVIIAALLAAAVLMTLKAKHIVTTEPEEPELTPLIPLTQEVTDPVYAIIPAIHTAAHKAEPEPDAEEPDADYPVWTDIPPEKPEWEPAEEDVIAIALTLWGECRGVESKAEQAAVVWCILNRLDAGAGLTVKSICAAPGQFYGYNPQNPLDADLVALARDVLQRHRLEQLGVAEVGRTLPKEYIYFSAKGDGRNWFRAEYYTNDYWDWSLPDPYVEE